MKVWVGSGTTGAMIDAGAASISIFDHGFTVGDGVFETVKCVDGRLFLWDWHMERLQRSAAGLGIALPDVEHLTTIACTVADAWTAEHDVPARLRLTVSAGSGPLGSARAQAESTVVCAAAPIPDRPGPATLQTAAWPRNERSPLVGIKSTSYAENVLALALAQDCGASEALFLNSRGYVCEGTGSNVFIVKNGIVRTPPVSTGLLPGVTRRFVLTVASKDMPITESNITVDQLHAADEVFLTSSLQDVRAVSRIDDTTFPVGERTLAIQRRFVAAAATAGYWTP